MRKLPAVFLFLVASFFYTEILSAVEIESVKYEPEKIRTGDSVFCRIKISGKKLTSEDAQNIRAEKNISFEVTDIKLNVSSNELLVWFIPFNPLEKYLPAVRGNNFLIDEIPVKITGYAESGDTAPEPPGAVLIPGTRLFLGFAFFLILLLFFSGYWFARYFYNPVKEGVSGFINEMEIKRILSEIKALENRSSSENTEQLFSSLSRLFRTYLEKRLKLPFMPLTSGEITDKLLSEGILSDRMNKILTNSLFCSDRIRFGKADKSLKKCYKEIFGAVEMTVNAVEELNSGIEARSGKSGKNKKGEADAV